MATSPAESEMEKKLMRLKKDELKVEARKLSLDESGTKSDLVISRNFLLVLPKQVEFFAKFLILQHFVYICLF